MSDEYVETLFGLVLPWGQDDDDIERFMLLADGEEEFLIELGKEGRKLADHVDRWVTVEGAIKEYEDYSTIKVYNYDFEDEVVGYDDDVW